MGFEIIASPDLLSGALRSGWDLYNALYRQKLIDPEAFDIVHGFETRPVVLLPALKMKKAGLPLVWDWADWFGKGGSVEERPNHLVKAFLRPVETYFEDNFRCQSLATTVICTTLKQKAIDLQVNPKSIYLLPNGLDIPGWKYQDKKVARTSLRIQANLFLIGYLGSLFPRDAALMANAFNYLARSHPHVRLVHIGQSNYRIKKMVDAPDKIIETGSLSQDELSQYLAACDLCWLPFTNSNANQGRFPMKLSHYLAAGKPVVSTDVGDVPEILKRSGAGRVVHDNPSDLANSVGNLIGEQTALREMANASIQLATNPALSWNHRAIQLEKIYMNLG